MRIALIAQPWVPVPPVAHGPLETVVDMLARGYKEAGHDVTLFTTPESTCPVRRRAVSPVIDKSKFRYVEVELSHVIRAYREAQDFDIVHDHTFMGPAYSLRYPDLKVVTTQHTPFDDDFADLYRSIENKVSIVGISHSQRELSRPLNVNKVIHHGLFPEEFPYGEGDGGYFLYLGRMAPFKGAARAARVAKAAGAKLIIAARLVDTEGEREYFENEVKPLLDEDIVYVGNVGGQEKLDLIKNARALINPIRWPEPFGLVMIEALACGTPVIAFPEGAAPEIVEDGVTGYLCADEDEMVQRVLEIDKIDRRACRASIEGHFNARRMVKEYLELFEELHAQRRPDHWADSLDLVANAGAPKMPETVYLRDMIDDPTSN